MSRDSPSAAPPVPSNGGGSIEPAAGGDAEAHLRAIQAEVDELFERQREYDPGTFAVLAWCAGFALMRAMERAWRKRGISEAGIDRSFGAVKRSAAWRKYQTWFLRHHRRPGARPDA